jgi:hypothetical protein
VSLSIGGSLKINSNIPKESGIDKTSFKEPRAENYYSGFSIDRQI